MPITRPNLQELIAEFENASTALIGFDEQPLSVQKAKSRQWGYAFNALYARIDYMGQQMIGITSEGEYLRRHCAEIGIFPKDKTTAYGPVLVKAVINSTLTSGTLLTRNDGQQYRITQDAIITTSPQEIELEALEPGATGNCAQGVKLTFNSAVEGVENTAIVKLIGAGADAETDADLLVRYLEFIRNLYLGGADSDYRKWALSVEGVSRAWVEPHGAGPGTVIIRIMTPTGFPDEVLLNKTLAYIKTKCPVTVKRIFVIAPNQKPIDLTIVNLTPDTLEMRAAIIESLNNALNTNAEPGGKVLLARLHAAILSAIGTGNYKLIVPLDDIALDVGEIATLGAVTWI